MKQVLLFFFSFLMLTQMMNAQDQGITSPTHQKNVGKIVFASEPVALQFKNETPSLFKTSFNADEPIYARVYTEKSMANYSYGGSQAYKAVALYTYKIDGKEIPFKRAYGMHKHLQDKLTTYTEEMDTDDSFFKWTSWRHYVLPNENDEELKYGNRNIQARAFALALLDLTPGTYEITLEVRAVEMAGDGMTDLMASGSFNLTLSSSDLKAMAFKYAPPLPKDEWRGGNKKEIIDQIAFAFEKQLGKKPLIAGISGMDWSEGTYRLTGQKYRKIAGWAVFEDTDGDGQVPVTTFNWISDYSNAGWTNLRFDSHCLGCPNWNVETEAVKALNAGR